MAAGRGRRSIIDLKELRAAGVKINELRSAVTNFTAPLNGGYWSDKGTGFSAAQRMSSMIFHEGQSKIKDAWTETGQERIEAAGLSRQRETMPPYSGRYETGAMYKGFKMTRGGGNTRKGKVNYHVEIGWLDGVTAYWTYQEHGTAYIKKMNALGHVDDMMNTFFGQELAKDMDTYLKSFLNGWAGYLSTRQGWRKINSVARKPQQRLNWTETFGGVE